MELVRLRKDLQIEGNLKKVKRDPHEISPHPYLPGIYPGILPAYGPAEASPSRINNFAQYSMHHGG
jgi:hypothetical protein